MITQSVWDGVAFFLDHYVDVTPEDHIVIVYTPQCREAAAWVIAALKVQGYSWTMAAMAPLEDPGFQARLTEAMPAPETVRGRLVLATFEPDTVSHAGLIRDALEPFPKQNRVLIRVMSAYEALFDGAVKVSPQELSARNATVLNRLMPAKNLRVKAPGGTDLSIEIDSNRYRWISNRGMSRPGQALILPAGEVATYPAAIDGTLVADFALNINTVTERDMRLDRWPVTLTIENSRVKDFTCENTAMQAFLERSFRDPKSRKVGELGFGTNPRVKQPIPCNSHINERCPGVHIGFGQHNQSGVLAYNCDQHLDLIARGAFVWCDGQEAPLDLARLEPQPGAHPNLNQEEDVFSPDTRASQTDCCGFQT